MDSRNRSAGDQRLLIDAPHSGSEESEDGPTRPYSPTSPAYDPQA
jgi:hypothetical protein